MAFEYLFHRKSGYFEGWYFKHQKDDEVIAFIPGVSMDNKGEKTAFIQIIMKLHSYWIMYPIKEFEIFHHNKLEIRIGNNVFSEKGIVVDINNEEVKVKGKIWYSDIIKTKYDIMGPFAFCPFMECRHGVISMRHQLKGKLKFNETKIDFDNGIGYIETDRGHSFPEKYLWNHCNTQELSVMVSIADIPFVGTSFMGCLCFIYYKGIEYRLATYLGVKILYWNERGFGLKQGKYLLMVDIKSNNPRKLVAPKSGEMSRIIYEAIVCGGRYRFFCQGKLIFEIVSNCVGFEFV
jgi:tocopherol cyclase